MTTDSCTLVTRRAFLTGLGATIALAACGGSNITVLSPKERGAGVAVGSLGATTDRVVVVVELGGGNDGLSMVVPHASGRYFDLRRATRIEAPIDLDGEIGFHPSLVGLAGMY
ncbi:MAG: twin-arginine translocation signal domain-containing protein, partial [Acidimicrobiia bacterium]|nr:twin-arginine translocation signal domain-containing protein [Acidimicrobiia bacterium]